MPPTFGGKRSWDEVFFGELPNLEDMWEDEEDWDGEELAIAGK